MQSQQLEARVSTHVEHVVAGGRVEDDRVECKAKWPDDHRRAARQLAGLANASSGESVLWIVGVDEDAHTVTHPGDDEPADWWAATRRWFADIYPDVSMLTVPTSAGSVIALLFDTSRCPYLVKTRGADGVDREVPWRQGTSTRSAQRSELIRSLVAQAQAPILDGIAGTIRVMLDAHQSDTLAIDLKMSAFVECIEPCRLPEHLWAGTLIAGLRKVSIDELDIDGPQAPVGSNSWGLPIYEGIGSITYVSRSALHVNGSDSVTIQKYHRMQLDEDVARAFHRARKVEFELHMPLASSDRVARLSASFEREKLSPAKTDAHSSSLERPELRIAEFSFGGRPLGNWTADRVHPGPAADFKALRARIVGRTTDVENAPTS